MRPIILVLIALASACITINKVQSRKVDDGYSDIKEFEKQYLHPFEINNLNQKDSIANFELINVDQIKKIAKTKRNLVVCVIATWCPVCHSYLTNLQKIKDSINHFSKGGELIIISQNFNITYEQKILKQNSFLFRTYIIDPLKYGVNELTKQDSLMKEFNSNHPPSSGSVPLTFILNNSGEIIFEKQGKNISAALLMSNFSK